MNRLLVLLIVLAPGAGHTIADADAAVRPNIIVLLTDDHRWDALGCAGNAIIRTPHLDALAAEGVRFRNAYVTTAICCTSRASILSGQFALRNGIHDFRTPFTGEALAMTYPQVLREAGYHVGFIGKYGVAGSKEADPAKAYDYWRAMSGQPKYENPQPDGTIKHHTDLVSEQCTEFLETRAKDRPFCLSVSYKAPHCQDGDPRQFIYHERHRGHYADVAIPPARNGSDSDFGSLPPVLATDENEGRVRWHLRFSNPDQYQTMVKGYYRLITGVDDAVARLRKDLEARGLSENTVIVFLGDHGFYLGEHGLAGKWYGHEESIRIPLIVYDPRLEKARRGGTPGAIALNIDIAPTVLEAAGVPVPASMQGRSLWPIVRGEAPVDWRTDFYYEHRFDHPGIPKSEGVAGGSYKYLRYYETDPVQEELFDLGTDPGETRNLALEAAGQDVLAAMRRRTDALRAGAAGE